MKFEWTEISNEEGKGCAFFTLRAKVKGGWLIKSLSQYNSPGTCDLMIASESMCFIPDMYGTWSVNETP